MSPNTSDTPVSRIMKYAEEIRNVAKELRKYAQKNEAIHLLTQNSQCQR